ncbi:trypsin-like peptidase domain-containing protein [Thermogemmatispora carboxidivorans]|uniref:trypsin-like peptidase domain-containing protein n=1 Tax=Thermogemmatispora carboxidivorans TaxID=1382306 RepID=UPI00069A63D4|nr:trypsin-like peptidase domain-containing protein [Thermogemmatispora carboxidivorans]
METVDSLEALLQRATVRIDADHTPRGTGFFVGPGLILTCAHVIPSAHKASSSLQIYWQESYYEATITTVSADDSSPDRALDLALLTVPLENHPCALLCGEAQPYSRLYTYGYPGSVPGGTSFIFDAAGPAGEQNQWITFQRGPVDPGMSGSPLLDRESGCVCGMIQYSLGLNSERGGQGLQARVILAQLPDLVNHQLVAHRQNRRWLELLSVEQRQRLGQCCPQYQPLLQQNSKALKIFLSCSSDRRDRQLRKELEQQLSIFKNEHLIESFHSEQLGPGQERIKSQRQLEEADIILLLISPAYVASEQCYNKEMQQAMRRHEAGTARIIPIILRPTAGLASTPFGKLQALPRYSPSITESSNRDATLAEIADELLQIIQELKSKQT